MKQILNLSLILLPFFIISCATGASSTTDASSETDAKTEIKAMDLNYDDSINSFTRDGWSVGLPEEWNVQTPNGPGSKNMIFYSSSDRNISISLYKLSFNFPVDYDALLKMVEKDLKKNGKSKDNGELPPEASGGRGTVHSWRREDDDGLSILRIEKNQSGYFEWRLHLPAQVHPDDIQVLDRIFREAALTRDNRSVRQRPNGFFFSSQGSPWRWAGDLYDGFLIESLMKPGDPYTLLGVYHPSKMDDGVNWMTQEIKNADLTMKRTYSIAGEPLAMLVSIKNSINYKKTAAMFNNEDDPLCIYIYLRDNRQSEEDINLFLTSPELENLLNYNLMIGREE